VTFRSRRILGLIVVVALAIGLVAVPPVAAWGRVALAIPLLLVLPGFALLQTLLGRQELDPWRFTLLTVGLSLAIVVVAGLVLALIGVRLQEVSWMSAVVAFTLIVGAPSILRAYRGGSWRRASLPWLVPRRDAVLLTATGLVLVAALAFARLGAELQPTPGFTQFWMVHGEGGIVHLGVRNFEDHAASFAVRVVSRGTTIASSDGIRLLPGQGWHEQLQFSTPDFEGEPLEATLFDANAPTEPVRRTVLWPGG
jgi:uncharacterized membrane protein